MEIKTTCLEPPRSHTARGENGEPLCASCSNNQYFDKIRSGEIVELKIDMRKVRPSTLMAIRAMIQKDIEEHSQAGER